MPIAIRFSTSTIDNCNGGPNGLLAHPPDGRRGLGFVTGSRSRDARQDVALHRHEPLRVKESRHPDAAKTVDPSSSLVGRQAKPLLIAAVVHAADIPTSANPNGAALSERLTFKSDRVG